MTGKEEEDIVLMGHANREAQRHGYADAAQSYQLRKAVSEIPGLSPSEKQKVIDAGPQAVRNTIAAAKKKEKALERFEEFLGSFAGEPVDPDPWRARAKKISKKATDDFFDAIDTLGEDEKHDW